MELNSVEFKDYMKYKLQFVEDVNFYTRGFTRVYIQDDKIFIGHTISKKRTEINLENLNEWISYFDRI